MRGTPREPIRAGKPEGLARPYRFPWLVVVWGQGEEMESGKFVMVKRGEV